MTFAYSATTQISQQQKISPQSFGSSSERAIGPSPCNTLPNCMERRPVTELLQHPAFLGTPLHTDLLHAAEIMKELNADKGVFVHLEIGMLNKLYKLQLGLLLLFAVVSPFVIFASFSIIPSLIIIGLMGLIQISCFTIEDYYSSAAGAAEIFGIQENFLAK